jgi:hypothetical protein
MQSSKINSGGVYAVSKKNKQGRYNVYGKKGNYGKPAEVLAVDPSTEKLNEHGLVVKRRYNGHGFRSYRPLSDSQEEKLEQEGYEAQSEPKGNGKLILVRTFPNDEDEESKIKLYKAEHIKMPWSEAEEKIEEYEERQQEKQERERQKREEFTDAVETIKMNIEEDLEEIAKVKTSNQEIRPAFGTDNREKFLEMLPYETEIIELMGIRDRYLTLDLEATKQLAQKLS